tara:strand:+ start:1111 stop:2016 length:906 start_codon:yes stop_codon:yes gene_type:complete
MKKLLIILFSFISWFANAQDYDFQQLCLDCAEANGFYCGDDPANWTQYAPNGCVVNNWLNDGWEDCVDATDENGAVPTTTEECVPTTNDCDTIYVDVPVIEYIYETDTLEIPFYIYETIIQFDTIIETEFITNIVIDTIVDVQFDTIYNTEYVTQIVVDTIIEEVEVLIPEYVYITDTVYAEVLDTMFVDIIEEVEVVVYDTIVETEIEYVEFFVTDTILQYDTIINTEYVEIVVVDSIIEYVEIINTEYVDCDTGLPCSSGIEEIIDKSQSNSVIYNLQGQAIKVREGLYIENGKVYLKK